MAAIVTRERVRGYDAFRRVCDSASEMRKAAGVLDEAVYRAEDDPNTVLITVRFSSLVAAHAFSASAELRDVMSRAGIEGGSRRVESYDET